MSIIEAIILGIVQGLTEFLPVSSSGHLVLLQKVFNIEEGALTFDIALHFATLLAVVVVYRKKIFEMLRNPFSKLPLYIIVGTIPIAVLGLLLNDLVESIFETGSTLGTGFIFTGLVLMYAESTGEKSKNIEQMGIKDPLLIGTSQAIAMLPAVSRSGMTISTALALGIERKTAADFSFLLSIPAILGAVVVDLYKVVKTGGSGLAAIGTAQFAAGMIFAAVSGFIAVKFMISLIQKKKLKYFSYYLWIIGALVLADQLFLHIFF
ncbi:undecaprenyl-diphosphatase UppP [Thermoclostridium stercorarium subsp. stercorarium DSM 8532]|jgi:undecaprenyl-diphosphatase|uniref:Undecaprenyl-diphosphatase n=3 Tax=Thermoclostridium stercorarium TaxID=1510 RepID=L7VSL1_THES1|nr:undecaprenyl-diphosphatase UppP [Thermoclostridium stercorarium]AGC69361.1 undecaprenyl-diphosphatase UppP [Thermoclostridium stercorarium subsp. stercorarium DSM 8532]AGI40322.1 UppP [Thermoclostridium stercorarium subsp. stercorarium DSM 8532]ANW99618.1 undecaprenyl-diphosphatase [Thermoclostridium stercorarium subsp. thermolacticum DSM 2910]ANX02245.1 undecaprenyl-diphosphatase [Thermoclostridium stercorarium subsp. leptospartum DSM 9219]UZQ85321.1 undecaprenyl-diphosphatase UppP [Thermo